MPDLPRNALATLFVRRLMLCCNAHALTFLLFLCSLTPCGHVACESCLVMWFSQPVEGGQDLEMPLLAPAMKKKTCPTCRAEVRSRPLVAYLIKSALHTVLPCLDPSTYDKMAPPSSHRPEDPWKGIFPDELGSNAARHRDNIHQAYPEVIIDEEDGGVPRCPVCLHEIFDGVCTGCSRLYAGISDDEDNDDIDSNSGILPWQRLYFPDTGVAAGPAGWTYSDDDHSEDDEAYESSFIEDGDDDANAEFDGGFDDQHDADLHFASIHSPARRTRRSRAARNAPSIPAEEERAPPPNPEHWQSYLTRAARRHGNVDAAFAPTDAGTQDASRAVDIADDSGGSDWAPRRRRHGNVDAAFAPTDAGTQDVSRAVDAADDSGSDWVPRSRRQRLAREARRRNPQHTIIVVSSEEDDGSDHGCMPSYLSDDEDIIIPPLALRRSARRRVVNVGTSEDGDSEDDVFEDAVSTEGRTVTSAGRQSSRYYAGTSHDEQSDSDEGNVVHRRDPMSDDDGDNVSRHWPSEHDTDSSPDVHGSTHDSSEDSHSDDASDEASDSSL